MASSRRVDGSYALNPGNLRHQVEFQRCTKTQDSMGQDTPTWATYCTAFAQVRAMQGRELEAYQQQRAEARFKIRLWKPSDDVYREDRIVWGSRTLDILDSEDPDGTGRTLEIVAREVVA